jgi:hypothetical protein
LLPHGLPKFRDVATSSTNHFKSTQATSEDLFPQNFSLLLRIHTSSEIKMLRRKPTAITLTTEDIANYEDTRAREAEARQREQAALQAQQNAQGQANNQNMRNPNDELRPLPGDRARTQQQVKTREERLGLGLGPGGGSSRS